MAGSNPFTAGHGHCEITWRRQCRLQLPSASGSCLLRGMSAFLPGDLRDWLEPASHQLWSFCVGLWRPPQVCVLHNSLVAPPMQTTCFLATSLPLPSLLGCGCPSLASLFRPSHGLTAWLQGKLAVFSIKAAKPSWPCPVWLVLSCGWEEHFLRGRVCRPGVRPGPCLPRTQASGR